MWEGPGPDPRACVCVHVCVVILLSESHTEKSENRLKEENKRSFRRKNICSLRRGEGGEWRRLNHLVNKVSPEGDTGGHVK